MAKRELELLKEEYKCAAWSTTKCRVQLSTNVIIKQTSNQCSSVRAMRAKKRRSQRVVKALTKQICIERNLQQLLAFYYTAHVFTRGFCQSQQSDCFVFNKSLRFLTTQTHKVYRELHYKPSRDCCLRISFTIFDKKEALANNRVLQSFKLNATIPANQPTW